MYREKRIALVIPAHNEQKLIIPTLMGANEVFDAIYVVDDLSQDKTCDTVLNHAKTDLRVNLIRHKKNEGPGRAIINGYLEAAKLNDIVVVVGGDNQMDLKEVRVFLDPIIDGKADYTKGNRFLLGQLDDTLSKMPKTRLIGNWIITLLTKISSGFYKIYDVVDGYTAISSTAIKRINWSIAWCGYGYPMDFLIRLNAYGFKVLDVPRTAIYTPGERQSQIKGAKYAFKVSPMLLKHFFWRLFFKYVYRDFHPLVLFYLIGLFSIVTGLMLGMGLTLGRLFFDLSITGPTAILCALMISTGLQLTLFAMFFDLNESK